MPVPPKPTTTEFDATAEDGDGAVARGSVEGLARQLNARIAERQAGQEFAQRRETFFGIAGVTVLVIGGGLLFSRPAQLFDPAAWPIVAATIAVLMPLVMWRRRWSDRRDRLAHAIEWLQQALRRLDDDFAFGQSDGQAYLTPGHPNADDLNLFGRGSLFERLNSCRTSLGRDALAGWVAGKPIGTSIAERRVAIEELAADIDLRERMEVELRNLQFRGTVDDRDREMLERSTRSLLEWMRTPTPPPPARWRVVLTFVAGALATVAFLLWVMTDLGIRVLAPFYLLNAAVLLGARDIGELAARFERVRETLDAWSRVLAILETMQVQSPLLQRMQAELTRTAMRNAAAAGGAGPANDGSIPASAAMARLKTLVDRLSQRRNALYLTTLDVLWLVDLHARRGLLDWKRAHGEEMARWIEVAADFEALCALATYRAAVPAHVFAEVIGGDRPVLEFDELAHPLLPASSRVGNGMAMSEAGTGCIVTGSNMSGKSTFLRTTGIAVVMSAMGLPVPARRLRMREDLGVVTCMNVTDSLHDASSLFHAEVRRLRQCLDLAAAGTSTLVLFDEILAGTNSRERHIGAVAILENLLRLPAVSLVSTHDLALAEVADRLPEHLSVVHFRDHVRDGHMTFDYRMRPGVLPSTNALRVMRLAGLDVPE